LKIIANIITEKELVNHKKLSWINYSQDIECDLNIPTLVIGWSFFKKKFEYLYPNILKKSINLSYPRVGWEFTIDERITDHFNGIESFIGNAPKLFIDNFKYKSIDPIKNDINNLDDLAYLLPYNGIYYQYKDEIIYLYDKINNEIYGVYLNAFDYFGLNKTIICEYFFKKYDSIIDLDGEKYQNYYREFPNFDLLKRSMVLFLM
jgi:hypothetical protein